MTVALLVQTAFPELFVRGLPRDTAALRTVLFRDAGPVGHYLRKLGLASRSRVIG